MPQFGGDIFIFLFFTIFFDIFGTLKMALPVVFKASTQSNWNQLKILKNVHHPHIVSNYQGKFEENRSSQFVTTVADTFAQLVYQVQYLCKNSIFLEMVKHRHIVCM